MVAVMTTQFSETPRTDLEHWAERYAPHQLTAYQYSDASGYMDFWEWLDLNHPGVLSEYKSQHGEEHP